MLNNDLPLVQILKARNGVSEVIFSLGFYFPFSFRQNFSQIFSSAVAGLGVCDRQISLGCGYRQLSPFGNGLLASRGGLKWMLTCGN